MTNQTEATAEMGELLPCPWCAISPKPIFASGRDYVQCETQGCWLYGVMARPHEWNTRTHPTAEPVDEMGELFDKQCAAFKDKYPWFRWSTWGPDMKIAKHFWQVRARLNTQEWQTIDSASKDGTLLCAEVNGCGKWEQYLAFYARPNTLEKSEDYYAPEAEEDDPYCPEGWYRETSDEERVNPCNPTHFQPLPTPPSARLTQAGEM